MGRLWSSLRLGAVADLAGGLGHGLDVDFGITLTDRVSVLVAEGCATGLLEDVLLGGLISGLVSDLAIGRFGGGCGNVEAGRFSPSDPNNGMAAGAAHNPATGKWKLSQS